MPKQKEEQQAINEKYMRLTQRIIAPEELKTYSMLFKIIEERKTYMRELSKVPDTEEALRNKYQTINYFNQQIGTLLNIPVAKFQDL